MPRIDPEWKRSMEAALTEVAAELTEERPLLPPWSPELEEKLREVYFAAPPRIVPGEPSMHTGLEAVYRYIRDELLNEG